MKRLYLTDEYVGKIKILKEKYWIKKDTDLIKMLIEKDLSFKKYLQEATDKAILNRFNTMEKLYDEGNSVKIQK